MLIDKSTVHGVIAQRVVAAVAFVSITTVRRGVSVRREGVDAHYGRRRTRHGAAVPLRM